MPDGKVAQGKRAAPEGMVCRSKLYGGTNFRFSGEAAKLYKLFGAI